jgi:hypothetical protein
MLIARLVSLVVFLLSSSFSFAQTPEALLSTLPKKQQDWVNQSCPRSLGPSLWSSCIQREARALKGDLPNIDGLEESTRAWLLRSCPASLGPSLAIACVSREVAALRSGMPNINALKPEQKNWLLQSCPESLGPSLFKSCVQREMTALTAGASTSVPQPNQPRQMIRPPQRIARSAPRRGADVYPIETSHNDELFIINGEKFEAKTYCFDMEEDDEVMFLDGSALGVCVSATLLNLRTREKCEVWCE